MFKPKQKSLGVEKYKHDGHQYEVRSIPFYLLERWPELLT